MYVSLCEMLWCRTAAAVAAVVPLLHCAGAFDFKRKGWVGIVQIVVFMIACPHTEAPCGYY